MSEESRYFSVEMFKIYYNTSNYSGRLITVGTTGIACGENVRLRSCKTDKLFSAKQEPRDFSRGRFRVVAVSGQLLFVVPTMV